MTPKSPEFGKNPKNLQEVLDDILEAAMFGFTDRDDMPEYLRGVLLESDESGRTETCFVNMDKKLRFFIARKQEGMSDDNWFRKPYFDSRVSLVTHTISIYDLFCRGVDCENNDQQADRILIEVYEDGSACLGYLKDGDDDDEEKSEVMFLISSNENDDAKDYIFDFVTYHLLSTDMWLDEFERFKSENIDVLMLSSLNDDK